MVLDRCSLGRASLHGTPSLCLGPPLLVPLDLEEVDEPVQVALDVRRVLAEDSSQVVLQLGAGALHYLSALQVDGSAHVRIVLLVLAEGIFDLRVVVLLPVVLHERSRGCVVG